MRSCPASLRASERALGEVREFAPVLRSSLESLREPIRKLDETNEAVIPFLRETEPVIRDGDPPVRARGAAVDRRPAPGAPRTRRRRCPTCGARFGELNRFFNIGAFNPGGAEGLDGKSISRSSASARRASSTGSHGSSQNGSSLFSTADGQGPWRRVTICGVPAAALTGIVNGVIADIGETTRRSPSSSSA